MSKRPNTFLPVEYHCWSVEVFDERFVVRLLLADLVEEAEERLDVRSIIASGSELSSAVEASNLFLSVLSCFFEDGLSSPASPSALSLEGSSASSLHSLLPGLLFSVLGILPDTPSSSSSLALPSERAFTLSVIHSYTSIV